MERQITILEIVLFAPTLYQHLPMGKDRPLPQAPMVCYSQSQEPYPTLDRPLATPSTVQPVAAKTAHSFTNVSPAELTTVLSTVPIGAALLNKPKPWTPIRSFILERELCNYPDKAFVTKLIHDLCHGCTIGYTGPQFSYLANNLVSAYQQPEVIDDTLKRECELGRILGPFESPPLPNFRTSGLGLVPKHDGGWRTIYHLSAPLNSSVNNFINPDDYSLSYCSIDDAYAFINELGPGTLLSKIDLKDAFRLIPINPSDWNLLGIHWRGKFYVDTCLPFGLRSAPYLFNRLSQMIHWILTNNYEVQHLLYYLDDFLTAGPADSPVCSRNLNAMLTLCQNINAPVKTSKIEGPSTSITFLGIHLNTVTMEASITAERKESLLEELRDLHQQHKCTKRQLLSLIGKLSFSCKVLPSGRIFLRRLIDLSTTVKQLHHHIRLTMEARLDLQWWLAFLPHWSGRGLILNTHWTLNTKMQLFTDASGHEGWGAYWSGRWLQDHWSPKQKEMSIAWKELYAIVMAVHTWGVLWQRQKILFNCDNQNVVGIWEKGSTKSPEIMALVRLLYFCAARHNIHVCVQHIPGNSNNIADAISRFQNAHFKELAPEAEALPENIPAWPTQAFTIASCSSAIMVSPNQHVEHTSQD